MNDILNLISLSHPKPSAIHLLRLRLFILGELSTNQFLSPDSVLMLADSQELRLAEVLVPSALTGGHSNTEQFPMGQAAKYICW